MKKNTRVFALQIGMWQFFKRFTGSFFQAKPLFSEELFSNHTGMDEIRVPKKKSILFNTTSSCHVQMAVKLNVKPEIYGP